MAYTLKQKRNYCLGAVRYCEGANEIDIPYCWDNPMDGDAVTKGDLWRSDVADIFDAIISYANEGHAITEQIIQEALVDWSGCGQFYGGQQEPIRQAFLKVFAE